MASRSWNKAELIGNLARDPELRQTPSGTSVCTFSIATNRSYKTDTGELREEVDFHRIVAWGKLGELCSQLLKKGMKAFVSGRIQNRSWEGQDGQKQYMTEIIIDDMIILSSKDRYEGGGDYNGTDRDIEPTREPVPTAPDEEPANKPSRKKQEVVNEDDLPF